MLMTSDPMSSRQATPRPIPSPVAKQSWWSDTNSFLVDVNSLSVDTVENFITLTVSVDANSVTLSATVTVLVETQI